MNTKPSHPCGQYRRCAASRPEYFSRGFFAIEIALNDIAAFDVKLAGFAIWQIIAVSINHLAFQSRHKRAAAFRLVDKIRPQNRGDDAACFGHAIAGAGFAIGQGLSILPTKSGCNCAPPPPSMARKSVIFVKIRMRIISAPLPARR